MALNGFRGVVILCVLAVTVNTRVYAQQRTAFQLQLDALSNAIQERKDYNQKLFTVQVNNQVNRALGRTEAAAASPDHDQSTKDIAHALGSIVQTLETADNGVFVGSGIAGIEITYNQTTSTWRSDHVRNFFDKARPILHVAGSVLTATSFALTAKNPTGSNSVTSGRGLSGILGMAAIAAGTTLQYFGGANHSTLQKDAGTIKTAVSSIQSDIAQMELSRVAYNDLKLRLDTANKYYTEAAALVDPLTEAKIKCDDMYDHPGNYTDDAVLAVIDQVSAANDKYAQIADFVDIYTDQLNKAYKNYADTFPVLASQIAPAQASLQSFVDNFNSQIKAKFLKDLPTFSKQLSDLRAKVGK